MCARMLRHHEARLYRPSQSKGLVKRVSTMKWQKEQAQMTMNRHEEIQEYFVLLTWAVKSTEIPY